jgi:hypothetical protein
MSLAYRLSVVANVALIAVTIGLVSHERGEPTAPAVAARAAESTEPSSATANKRAAPARRPESTADLFARLEKAGVATTVLADIVRTDHRRRWSKRVFELENRFAPKQPPQREYIMLRRLEEEDETRALKQALGEQGYAAWDREQTLQKLNFEEVAMSSAEEDRVYDLEKRLEDKLREMQLAMEDGDADIADMGTLQMQAQDAYEKDLEKLLDTQRYQQLKGYTIPVVEGHLEFNELSPTPEQVTALQAAVSDYQTRETDLTTRLADKPADPATIAAELKTYRDEEDARLRDTIGADAYANFKRDHDDTYQTLTQYSQAWNLKDGEIEPVYDKIKAYVDNVDRLRRAAQLTQLAGEAADWNTINATIEQSRQQTEADLQSLIGPDRAHAIERNGLLSPKGSDRNAPHGGGS